VIVVLGRPALVAFPGSAAPTASRDTGTEPAVPALGGLAASVAVEIARRGSRVELVGSIGDDPIGDEVVVELGRAGIGHAALLRDPAGSTAVAGHEASQPSRLDAADVELGLRYVTDARVLIVAEPLSPDAEAAAIDGAAYHDASLIAVLPERAEISSALSAAATILEEPRAEHDPADRDDEAPPSEASRAFASFVAALAILLEAGTPIATAFSEAARSTGWERASGA
jgi:pfkB family carbohydrate kinase